jgi:hypothetical protein
MRDLVDVQPDGSVRYRQSDAINTAMFESLLGYAKDFSRVKAPALSLFAPVFFPAGSDSIRARQLVEWEAGMFEPYREASIERFRRETALGRDTLLQDTNHASIGVVDLSAVATLIRSFLLGHQQ